MTLPPLRRVAFSRVSLDLRAAYFAAETMILREVLSAYAWDLQAATAIDVGAHVGAWTCAAALRFPGVRVAAVEVEPESFAVLRHNTAALPGVRLYHARCGYDPAPHVVARHAYNSGSTRVFRADDPALPALPAHVWSLGAAPPPITLEQVIADCGFARVDVLKLDCEGAEVEILNHLHPDTWAKLGVLLGEIHQLPADFQAATGDTLQRHGFRMSCTPHPANPLLSTFVARRP